MTTRFLVCGSVMMLAVACGGSDETAPEGAPAPEVPAASAASPEAPASPAPSTAEQPAPAPAAPVGTAKILEHAPEKGAIGVMPDAKIQIAFAQPMDRASTEAAFSLGGTLVVPGSFAWSNGDSLLTFTPANKLDVGLDMNITIAASAKDKEGHGLVEPFQSSFRTIRRVTTTLAQKGVLQCAAGGGSIYIKSFQVGDDAANKELGALVAFDITSLPADIKQIEAADVTLGMTKFVSEVKVTATSITPGDLLDCTKDWNKSPRTAPNPFVPGKDIPFSGEVKDQGNAVHAAPMGAFLALDWANRAAFGNKLVYRLQATGFAANGVAEGVQYGGGAFAGSEPQLVVTYLQP